MKKVQILFTGGTIAMRTNDAGMLVPAVSGDELIASIPALQKIAKIVSIQFSNLPSAHITPELMLRLQAEIITQLSDNTTSGLVIVHGTDTMEETAFFLDACLSNADLNDKPVILTGAMRSNDQASADGALNLLGAVRVAAAQSARERGVMAVMNDEIHAARYVRKMSTSSVQTFCSPQHMPIGMVTHDANDGGDGVRFSSPAIRFTPIIDVSRETSIEKLPRVDIVQMYAGADSAQLDACLVAGARAIVVQAVGASSVNLALYEAIKTALAQGVAVVLSSRSPLGVCSPVYGYAGGGKTLAQLGAVFAHDLPAHKARLFAQLLLLGATNDVQAIAQGFSLLG